MVHPDPILTYCATLRSALEHLVQAIEGSPHSVYLGLPPLFHVELEEAYLALSLDQAGIRAAAEMDLHLEIAGLASVMADYLHYQCYGRPRNAAGRRPTPDEIVDALQRLEVLTATAAAGVVA